MTYKNRNNLKQITNYTFNAQNYRTNSSDNLSPGRTKSEISPQTCRASNDSNFAAYPQLNSCLQNREKQQPNLPFGLQIYVRNKETSCNDNFGRAARLHFRLVNLHTRNLVGYYFT